MGRAEAFAMQNPPGVSFLDGFGNGLGYSVILIILGTIRELFGTGTILEYEIFPLVQNGGWYVPNNFFLLPPVSFILIGLIIWALRAWQKDQIEEPEFKMSENSPEIIPNPPPTPSSKGSTY